MQVTETLNEGLKRGYKIVVPAKDLDDKVNEKLAEAAPEIEMKGFRKGKVPMPLSEEAVRSSVCLGEAMQESVDGAMAKHSGRVGRPPGDAAEAGNEESRTGKPGQDVEVEMSYEALPEIPEVDFATIKLEKMVVEADDKCGD